MTIETLLEEYQDHLRDSFNKYTRKAFQMLPELDKPHILDIGCGSGIPTIELAMMSNGQIIGLDIQQSLLDKLERKIEESGLSDRVRTVKCSMFEIDFPDESFDIIWAEGSINAIGFENGLKTWRRFLKPDAFLVVHDDNKDIINKRRQIPECGYNLHGYFSLPRDAWWIDYFSPLEKKIKELRMKYSDDPEALKILEEKQNENEIFKADPENLGSVFYIMQKV
ncbi:MAG: class I SAM-dependent methyltransferase [Methanosarcinaceae archaeon]|nr:class I SAM-dependent methyltransferase [Methanosarcinaceae archaeon]